MKSAKTREPDVPEGFVMGARGLQRETYETEDRPAASVSEPGLIEMAWGTMRAAWREGDYDGAAAVGAWLGLFVAVLLAVLGLFVYALVEVGYAIA